MAVIRGYAIGMVALSLAAGAWARAEGPITLKEVVTAGATTRSTLALKAKGLYRPAPTPGAAATETPKPLDLKVETKLEFSERVLTLDAQGRPSRTARRVLRAGSALNGQIRPQAATLRPSVAVLIAEPRSEGVVVYSPLGPLTRPELELVQGPGDPLSLDGLLPVKPVEPGGRWKSGDSAALALCSYDTLNLNALEATLQRADDAEAVVTLKGEVRGSVLGGDGVVAINGSLTFDRKANRIKGLSVERIESRTPGPVEAGLDVTSTLTLTRVADDAPPAELAEAALARLNLDGPDAGRDRERLLLSPPSGRYALIHDRNWHTYWDDNRLTVLKRVERGETIAQCNLAAGPPAGKGRHQDPEQFRTDIRKSLGPRFSEFLGAGEFDGDPAGHYRFKVGVRGRQGELGVIWYYYLVASPEGEQTVATFTLAEPRRTSFGNEDERLMATFRWVESVNVGR